MAITIGGVVKTVAVSGAACGVALIAPLGMAAVVGVTVAVGVSSLFVETLADEMKQKKDDKKD